MPGMSGSALAAKVVPRRPKMKVLYMSGYPDDTVARHGALGGPGTHHLQKPFSLSFLEGKVRELLDPERES